MNQNCISLNRDALQEFTVGLGSFLYGNPPTVEKPEMDIAVILSNGSDLESTRVQLQEKARLFEEQFGVKVDGWVMTESEWTERQRRVFGAYPHVPQFMQLEEWQKPAYIILHGDEFVKQKMEYCRVNPIFEGILPPNVESRFGSGAEVK